MRRGLSRERSAPATHVAVVAAGIGSADAVWSALDERVSVVLDPAQLVGPDWWLIEADVQFEDVPGLLEKVSSVRPALLVQGDVLNAGSMLVTGVDAAVEPFMFGHLPDGSGADQMPSVLRDWLVRHAPRPPDAEGLDRLWRDLGAVKAYAAMDVVLAASGWQVDRPRAGRSHLVGYKDWVRPALPHLVGERRVDWDGAKYIGGRASDQWGIWDQDHPGPPIQTFPGTREGRMACTETLRRLVTEPMLAATLLDGDRSWAAFRRREDVGALMVHRKPGDRMSVHEILSSGFRTIRLGPADSAFLHSGPAREAGLITTNPAPPNIKFPIASQRDAERAAEINSFGKAYPPWHEVPDTVSRSYRECCAWVLAEALRSSAPGVDPTAGNSHSRRRDRYRHDLTTAGRRSTRRAWGRKPLSFDIAIAVRATDNCPRTLGPRLRERRRGAAGCGSPY